VVVHVAYNDAGAFTFAPADLTTYATSASVTSAISTNNASYISIADLKTLVAGTSDYSEFQTAIAAL